MLSCPLAKFKGHSFASQPVSEHPSFTLRSLLAFCWFDTSTLSSFCHSSDRRATTVNVDYYEQWLSFHSSLQPPLFRFLSLCVCAQAICAMDILGAALRCFDKRCQLQNVLKDCAQCTDFCGCLPPACGGSPIWADFRLSTLFLFGGLRTRV